MEQSDKDDYEQRLNERDPDAAVQKSVRRGLLMQGTPSGRDGER